MTAPRLPLIFAGAAATAIIAFAATIKHGAAMCADGCAVPAWVQVEAGLLLTYAFGLGLGTLMFRGRNRA